MVSNPCAAPTSPSYSTPIAEKYGPNKAFSNFIIGRRAFSACESLESLVLPPTVTFIGKEAFIGCSSLRKIEILSSYVEVEVGAFLGCHVLRESQEESAQILREAFPQAFA